MNELKIGMSQRSGGRYSFPLQHCYSSYILTIHPIFHFYPTQKKKKKSNILLDAMLGLFFLPFFRSGSLLFNSQHILPLSSVIVFVNLAVIIVCCTTALENGLNLLAGLIDRPTKDKGRGQAGQAGTG